MNWLQKIASDEFYEETVFAALRKQNLLSAIDALKEHGPRGMDLWVKFKDEFQQDPQLLSDWILESTTPVVPQREDMDEIDEWAAKARGLRDRGTRGAPRPNFTVDRGTGGAGINSTRNPHRNSPSGQNQYYRHH